MVEGGRSSFGGDVDGVLYFGNDLSGGNRTSAHHIAMRLARHERLVYVESPGLRAPSITPADLQKVATKLRNAIVRGKRPDAGSNGASPHAFPVETAVQVPFHRYAPVRLANRVLLRATAERIKARHGLRRPITWFTVPHLAPLVGGLGEALSVYYCVDDYAEMPGMDRASVRAMDEHMTRTADVVFVTSETLLERKRALNPNTFVSPHGVDVEHFGRAQDPTLAVPDELTGLRGPVVGYFGLIDGRTDLELVAYLADQRPSWTFVMIGQFAVPESSVPRRPNLIFPGRRPYEALPAYGKRFDAVIVPYRRGEDTRHANPLKLREYLAMGKPVVAVSIPQTRLFAEVVDEAATRDEFLAALDRVIAKGPDPERAQRAIARVADMSWDARFRDVVAKVTAALDARRARGGAVSLAPPIDGAHVATAPAR